MPAATTTTTVAPEPPQIQLWYRPTGDKVLEPFSSPITAAEHKIRNLEKRKLKLDQYRNEQAEGKTLNADQLAAVAKYNEVIQQLDHNRELVSCLRQVHQQTIKFIKQELRRENADRNKFILSLQAGLDQLQNPNVQHDFLVGEHGAVKVTEEDLTDLTEVSKLVRPSLREPDFAAKIETGAEVVAKLFESRGKVNNKPSQQLKTMIDSIVESQYFTSGPTPIVPIETVEEVVPRPQEATNPVHVPEIPMGNNNPVPAQIMMNQGYDNDRTRSCENEYGELYNICSNTGKQLSLPVKARLTGPLAHQIMMNSSTNSTLLSSVPSGLRQQQTKSQIPTPLIIGVPSRSPVLQKSSPSPALQNSLLITTTSQGLLPSPAPLQKMLPPPKSLSSSLYGNLLPKPPHNNLLLSPIHGEHTQTPEQHKFLPSTMYGNSLPRGGALANNSLPPPLVLSKQSQSPILRQSLPSPESPRSAGDRHRYHYHPYSFNPKSVVPIPSQVGDYEVRYSNPGSVYWRDRDMAYSFMQESQLEIESPHMDPAVVAVSSYAPPPPQIQPQPENNHVFTPAVTEGLNNIQSGVRDLNLNHMNSNNGEEEDDWEDKITTATFNNSTSVNGNMEGGEENTNGFDRSGRGSFRGRGGRGRGRGNGYGNGSRPPKTGGGSRGGFHQGARYGAFRAERIGQSDAETGEFRGKGGRGFPRSFRGNGNAPPSAGGPPRRGGRGTAKTFNGIHEPRSSE